MSNWGTIGHNINAKALRDKHARGKAEERHAIETALRIGAASTTLASRPITLAKVAWLDRSVEFERAYEAKYGNLQRRPDRKGAARSS